MTPEPLEALRLPIVPIEPRPEFAAALLRRIEGAGPSGRRSTPTVRYFVDDLDRAVAFYCQRLEFEEELRHSPNFAMLYRGDLRLLLNVPSAAYTLPDGTVPQPGGWNCIALQVSDLDVTVQTLRTGGVRLRTDIRAGVGVRSVLIHDPSGNPIELFEPLAGYHERA